MALVEPGYTIDDRVMRLEVQQAETTRSHARMQVTLDRIDTRVDGRPSWAIVMMVTFLATVCGILATALAAGVTGR